MLPKIKGFIKKNKKEVRIGIIILACLVLLLVLYKMLFYSDSEKAVYGVRLRGIEDNKFTTEKKVSLKDDASSVEGVKSVKVQVKGRLIKLFVTFEDGISTDDIKSKFEQMLGFIDEDVKSYYDVTFYAIQNVEDKTKYPVIGYKQKGKELISFDVL